MCRVYRTTASIRACVVYVLKEAVTLLRGGRRVPSECIRARPTHAHTRSLYVSDTNLAWGVQGAKRVHPRETNARQVP